jgi:hypothetical protein
MNQKREFEGNLNNVGQGPMESRHPQIPLEYGHTRGLDSDILKQIKEDYGIYYLGRKVYEVMVDGIIHQGTLAQMFELLRTDTKPEASG